MESNIESKEPEFIKGDYMNGIAKISHIVTPDGSLIVASESKTTYIHPDNTIETWWDSDGSPLDKEEEQ